MRKILSSLMILVLCVSMCYAGGVGVTINGNAVQFTQNSGAPFIDDAWRTQVPLRQTMETYGCEVDWDGVNRIAIVKKDNTTVYVPIGKKEIYINEATNIVPIDTQAQIIDSRTYLPIRAVLEAFGAEVSWDATTYTVIVKKPVMLICNSNTLKAHKDGCKYIKSIKTEHRATLSVSAAKSAGYTACSSCHPF